MEALINVDPTVYGCYITSILIKKDPTVYGNYLTPTFYQRRFNCLWKLHNPSLK